MSTEFEWRGNCSWWNHVGMLIWMALLVAGAIGLQFVDWMYKGVAGLVLAGIAFLLFLSALWNKSSSRYGITSQTVVAISGIFSQETHEVDIRDIRDVVLKQSLAGRILNYGTLEFSSAGRPSAEVRFEGIPDPKGVKQRVAEIKRSQQIAPPNSTTASTSA